MKYMGIVSTFILLAFAAFFTFKSKKPERLEPFVSFEGVDSTFVHKAVNEVARRSYTQMMQCYQHSLSEVPNSRGKINFSIEINEGNRAANVVVLKSSLNDASLTNCAKKVISSLKFPVHKSNEKFKFSYIFATRSVAAATHSQLSDSRLKLNHLENQESQQKFDEAEKVSAQNLGADEGKSDELKWAVVKNPVETPPRGSDTKQDCSKLLSTTRYDPVILDSTFDAEKIVVSRKGDHITLSAPPNYVMGLCDRKRGWKAVFKVQENPKGPWTDYYDKGNMRKFDYRFHYLDGVLKIGGVTAGCSGIEAMRSGDIGTVTFPAVATKIKYTGETEISEKDRLSRGIQTAGITVPSFITVPIYNYKLELDVSLFTPFPETSCGPTHGPIVVVKEFSKL